MDVVNHPEHDCALESDYFFSEQNLGQVIRTSRGFAHQLSEAVRGLAAAKIWT